MCLPQFFTASALRVRLAGSGSAAAAAFRLGLSLAFAALVFPVAFFALTFAFAVVRIDAPRALGAGGAGPHPPSEARMEAASFPDSRLPCSTCDPRSAPGRDSHDLKNSGATHAPPATASTTPAALPTSAPLLLGSMTATSGDAFAGTSSPLAEMEDTLAPPHLSTTVSMSRSSLFLDANGARATDKPSNAFLPAAAFHRSDASAVRRPMSAPRPPRQR